MFSIKSIPNYITLFRIAIIPIIIFTFYLRDSIFINRFGAGLFLFACLTDFIDGWLARKLNCQSHIGEMLDPLADKILVSSILVLLVKFNKISIIPCLLIIGRELTVLSLRSSASTNLKVTWIAKIKTFVQMSALFLFLLGNTGSKLLYIDKLATILLWIATFMTIYSGYLYLIKYIKHNVKL